MKRKITSLFTIATTLIMLTPLSSAAEPDVNLESESGIVIDANTGKVLNETNSKKRMYPASITKIMTAIVAIEKGDLNETVTVSEKARDVIGTRVYLEEGEKVPLKKLIQGTMINSGNDAAIAIAEHVAGSTDQFANLMNTFAEEKIGVTDSHFVNPHGLFDKSHYTTAYDMAKITQYAMNNQVFRDIVSTKKLNWKGKSWETTLYNHNRLLWRYKGANGVKNGWIDQSGHTLVTSAKRGDTELLAVVLKAKGKESSYQDTMNLLDFGFEHYQSQTIPKGKNYRYEDKHFTLTEPFSFTYQKDAPLTKEVTASGWLRISSEGSLINQTKLNDTSQTTSAEQPQAVKHEEKEEQQDNPALGSFLTWFIGLFQ
ncbi:D-alanyl-D-alanine carboxypeptidase family protein [Thalassobacillus sp. CUG 92003]|uniref:D-alanyl-D-alanine carboxypeptidase family protein n=1 Tax=Thalassobacillus sp. CUG 92003 TaxID=2736641 RepID=UPI0015E64EB6|nr:D-alanyl-D-alanine carboxypeptidase family protein [Thalassobacillus sp. CUG 92003]